MKKVNATRRMVVLLLMTLLTLSVSAQSVKDKTVTLDMTQVTVKQFFAEVKKQTGLNFIYSTELAKTFPKVTVKAQNRPVRQVLNEVMNKINCTYDVEGNIVTVTRKISGARTRTVSGTVKDESGDPLPGVSICIDDSKVCTITDVNGFYTLKVPANACDLKYSFVGMDNAVAHLNAGNGHMNQDVTMTSSAQLDEVVVTGYQEISRPKMTGSVTTINADALTERYTGDIVSNLEGRVAGLSTYGGELKVRGTSSLYAESSPLLVVDGLPMEGRLEDLNQYDIQSINVLKDAAATAIYGARATNGVIVITTKNAHKKGKIDIDFTANLSMYEKKNMDYHDNFYMNAEEQVAKESEYLDYYYKNNPMASMYTMMYGMYGIYPTSELELGYYNFYSGAITQADLDALKAKLSKNNFAQEYADEVYRRQIMQEYNLALRGRSDKTANNLTLNLQTDNSGEINTMSKRFTINYKGSFELAKWLTANASINAVYNRAKRMGYDYSTWSNNPWHYTAYESMYDEEGNRRKLYGWYDGTNSPFFTVQDGLVDLATDPVEEHYNNVETVKRMHMRYHGELLFNLFKGFSLSTQFVYESDHITDQTYANAESHPVRVLKNAYATYNPATGEVTYPVCGTGGFKRTTNTDGQYWTGRVQANYVNTFGKHAINALAGIEFRETKQTGTNSLLLGFDEQLQSANTVTLNLGDMFNMRNSKYFMSAIGGFPAYQFAFAPYIESGMDPIAEVKHRYASGYANVTYTYNERYNLFASFRKDYADVFGLNSKYRGKPLWSVGGAWNMEQEDFMKSIEWVNFLKLRLSYGATGNIYQGATSYMTASTGSLNYYTKVPYAQIQSPANPNLRWEKTYTTNIGVDFSLWNNRVRGNIDYYYKDSKDVFARRSIDPTMGYSYLITNSASMVNKGIELQVTADWIRPMTRKDFGWSTSFTLAHNSNTVKDVQAPGTHAYDYTGGGAYVEGYPASAVWSYRFAGIDDGSISGSKGVTLWYGNDDVKAHGVSNGSPDILEYSGQRDPKIIMGMDNRLEWNGFHLSVMMAYYGGHVMRALPETEVFGGIYMYQNTIASYFVNSWTPENPTNTPGWGQYGSSSLGSEPMYGNNSIRKADFLKIRNIVFGYTFPREWLSPLGINRLALQFQVTNPCTLWKANKVNVDPETLGIRLPANYVFTLNVNL